MKLAPIVLFVYNRPWHTQQTVEALQKNELASESDLFIYSDAAKNDQASEGVEAVREYIDTINGFKKITLIKRDRNWGLADSIIEGVTGIVNEYGKVIVLEDDLVTSPYFLKYMNDALEFYKNTEKVWHISGWNYPIEVDEQSDVFLWRGMSCWGWSTWKNRWQYFEKDAKKLISNFSNSDIKIFNLDGYQDFWNQVIDNKNMKINTWAVFWYSSIFKHKALCVNPSQTFVSNIGVDGSGSNCNSKDFYQNRLNNNPNIMFTSNIIENIGAVNKIKEFNRSISNVGKLKKGILYMSKIAQVLFRYMYRNAVGFIKLYRLRIRFPGSYIESKTYISYKDINLIKLYQGTYIGSYTAINVINIDDDHINSYFELGENSTIGELNNIRASGGKIIIGKNCLISQNVSMIAANHKIKKERLIVEQEWDEDKVDILVGDDVWIGSNAVILPGVKIGQGAVIGAGSIVTKDIKEYSIVTGIPAKHIRYRE